MPVLTVVFLFSYGLMTMLIIEQGAAIQQQHNFIQVLLGDSRELWAMKGKILTDRTAQEQARKNAQAQTSRTPPSTQAQSNQTQATDTPSTQAQQQHAQNGAGKAEKPQNHTPQTQAPHSQVPPMPASDLSDRRRVLIAL